MIRDQMLERATQAHRAWDIVIIGGGATGLGCALDASLRGISVLLLERHDFGKGTSSRSTKLIHGGVRYLKQGAVGLVRDSLRERSWLQRNAPHLVQDLPFLIPCYTRWEGWQYGSGLKFYDWLAGESSFGRSRWISARDSRERIATLGAHGEPGVLRGGVLYHDGQFDDARLIVTLMRSAQAAGAVVLNYAPVMNLTKDVAGRVSGVEFSDAETGQVHRAAARIVVNATGPFCDTIRQCDRPSEGPLVSASQGTHVVLPRRFLPGSTALMVPKTSDNRVMFIIPWHQHVLLGTTDLKIDRVDDEPVATQEEIAFLLETAGRYLVEKPKRADILSVFTGIRPLVRKGPTTSTASLSRDHHIEVAPSGLITITGGKWTSYRGMGQDVVDCAVRVASLGCGRSTTAKHALYASPRSETHASPRDFNLHWRRVYGEDAESIDQWEQQHPEWSRRLHDDLPYSLSEVVWAVRSEMARTVEDVLARRTRALFLNAKAAMSIAADVATCMAAELGKDAVWIQEQTRQFDRLAAKALHRASPPPP
jgi:glycerol-3-phosphate dehydrogenase